MKYLISLLLCISTPILAKQPNTPSLRDKIGQMLLVGFDGKQVSASEGRINETYQHIVRLKKSLKNPEPVAL